MDADKPRQSMAIAYAMKKRAKQMGYGGMAKGGMCKHGEMNCEMCHGGMMAEGGMAHAEDDYDPMEKPRSKRNDAAEMEDDDMVDRIMRKRMSEGGRVANDDEVTADFEPNEFDDLVKDDHLEAHYPGSEELGDEQEDMDRHDIVSRIMRSRMKKDRNPRPA
jgi:hypothetical protein